MSCSGTVKFFHDLKGFGFISNEDGAEDIFCHRNECQGGQPMEGDVVHFDTVTDERSGKLKAVNVTGGSAPFGKGKGKGDGKGKSHAGGFHAGGFDGSSSGTYGGMGLGAGAGGWGGSAGQGESGQGIAKFFNEMKGFGFISTSMGDMFVHRNECLEGQPVEGDMLHFDVVTDQRSGKLKAVNVRGGSAPLSNSQSADGKGFWGGKF